LFGTCAGAIILGREPPAAPGEPPEAGRQPPRMGLACVDVRRNAYGRQIDSFRGPLQLEGAIAEGEATREFEGVFIRAPRFAGKGDGVEVLARRRAPDAPGPGEAVLVKDGRILLAAFHPELTADLRVHRFFVERV
ncbi:MAG: hypothetical protein ACRELB_05010, partial [Polyangiaceae bacterium]